MDEEADFANLLSQSTISKPTWTTTNNGPTSPDPWANPFSSESPTNPFASSTSAFGSTSAYVPSYPALSLDTPAEEGVSPYVAKLEEDDRYGRGNLPDPPSVIAAREQEAAESEAVFGNPYATSQAIGEGFQQEREERDTFTAPYSPPAETAPVLGQSPPPPTRKLPSDLIDEDLLAASDPSVSLKKAFVKSSPARRKDTSGKEGTKAYVFKPGKGDVKEAKPVVKDNAQVQVKDDKKEKQDVKEETLTTEAGSNEAPEVSTEEPAKTTIADEPSKGEDPKDAPEDAAANESTPTAPGAVSKPSEPESIPLPSSEQVTPSPSRIASPIPTSATRNGNTQTLLSATNDLFSPSSTPKHDRVAVSPLDPPPPAEKDYGFRNLAIGGSSQAQTAPPPPPKSDWTLPTPSTGGSRFAGKGWAAVDETDDLFGGGGPSVKADPWGGADDGEGWAGDNVPTLSGPSKSVSNSSSPVQSNQPLPSATHQPIDPDDEPLVPKRKTPLFQISVGDPTKVGDPVRGYTVYTVRTRTTSPHYRKSEISVLRRFSEFLWLFDALTQNNPGVIVPPMPDKQPWGRFQDQFVETRRQALQRCLTKITSHPILQLDPDLRLFLESDTFAIEAKNRRLEAVPEKTGILAGWTGPRYFEQDDWFDSRKNFLDALESQLKGLSKSIESASKARLELAVQMGDYAISMTDLGESDLGSAMCAALARLSDLAKREKEVHEEQAKGDVMTLLNMSDEYVRFIGSVRLAFAARIKAYHHWQNMEKEVGRMKSTREKLRQQGRLGDRVNSSLGEINAIERRVRDSSVDFENISKLIKSEFVRFERERVEEFKRILEGQLDMMIQKQKELIEAWEEYHGFVLKMVQKSQGR